ncbi:Phosphatidylserine/phosphatidylglycerophosphate/cardiolipin synthase [Halobiforma haloterrestris]|uniref:Phosphatidylserine/phosphatidylglycerophosphate/cardiolipin synthase n=1 Tax=Natronobacterium haloterrestre TaxID=148448 RepID=A0A1I1EZG8_NATHA|nr:phospholipase D-like domain-containing protein [Halobiforma haloterrestris]SFB92401.1 Phosphatidylserine/phosphatidylglycerophosphate/cardiolipin synthase [Halobiforma haloterrestris]
MVRESTSAVHMLVLAVVLACIVALGSGIPIAASAPTTDGVVGCPHDETVLEPGGTGPEPEPEPDLVPEPRIIELYPNPTTDGNVGEYVLLETPPDTRVGNWTLTDGYRTASFPNETVSGRVAASVDPEATDPLTDAPVVELEGAVRLAVDGDDLELRTEADGGTERLDAVSYDRAPTGDRWYRADTETTADAATPASGYWWPRDATCRPVVTGDAAEATAFVLPDSPEIPLETIRSADERLLLAGYTVTSDAVADELIAAAERGVDVAVLLESGPVGGIPKDTAPVLERLENAGVDVRAIGGEGARYRYHHPKYAVADDRLLVTTENWKQSGVGGESNRGWGIVLEDETLAAELETVFETDFEGWDTRNGAEFRREASFVADDAPPREFPTVHDTAAVELESAELLVAPDNAERRLVELIDEADDELLVVQGSIDPDARVLEAAVDAARRGVDVRILLDSTWYREDENAALATELERIAGNEELPLEVRLVGDTDRFEKIHAKGLVIDREVAVVGSANWNDNAFRNNREVLVAAHGPEVAEFYAAVFEDDWSGDGGWTLPLEFGATAVLVLVAAALVGRRYLRFGDERPPGA